MEICAQDLFGIYFSRDMHYDTVSTYITLIPLSFLISFHINIFVGPICMILALHKIFYEANVWLVIKGRREACRLFKNPIPVHIVSSGEVNWTSVVVSLRQYLNLQQGESVEFAVLEAMLVAVIN
jgi:hypothetical protein